MKHTDFNFTKADQWGIALKKPLYGPDILVTENNIPTHRDSRTNTSDIIDDVISSPAIYDSIKISP